MWSAVWRLARRATSTMVPVQRARKASASTWSAVRATGSMMRSLPSSKRRPSTTKRPSSTSRIAGSGMLSRRAGFWSCSNRPLRPRRRAPRTMSTPLIGTWPRPRSWRTCAGSHGIWWNEATRASAPRPESGRAVGRSAGPGPGRPGPACAAASCTMSSSPNFTARQCRAGLAPRSTSRPVAYTSFGPCVICLDPTQGRKIFERHPGGDCLVRPRSMRRVGRVGVSRDGFMTVGGRCWGIAAMGIRQAHFLHGIPETDRAGGMSVWPRRDASQAA